MTPVKWIGNILMSLLCGLFLGIFVVSMGLGAVFPAIDKIAGPFVCAGGSLQEQSKNFRVHPGEKVTTINWSCAAETAAEPKNVNSWMVSLVAGTIYGFIIFIPVFLYFVIKQRRKASKI
jgi:hypothetical protein